MAHQKTPAQIREFIRSVVFQITGQRLSSRRIKLLQNPHAESRITYYPHTGKITLIAIGNNYWKGSEGLLRAVIVHEVMNTKAETQLTPEEMVLLTKLKKASSVRQRIAIRVHYEVKKRGWRRILARKLEVDLLSLAWLFDHGYSIMDYVQFLVEEWNEAMKFSPARRKYHRLIGVKRVHDAAHFLELHPHQDA